MAHKEPSHLDLHCLQMCVRIYLMSEYTRLYPTCSFFSLFQKRTGGDGSENAAGFANLLLIGLATFSTAYNVILYVVFNPTFKRAIHDILKCAKSDMVRLELNDGVTPSPQECDDALPVATYTSRIFTVKSHAAT